MSLSSTLEIKDITIRSAAAEKGAAKNRGETLVNGASFTLRSGEIAILLGANGSGKSSLVNGIFSHPKYEIASGEIALDGEDITRLSPDKKAKKGLFLSLQHLPEIDGVSFLNFLFRGYREMKNLPELSILDFKKILDEKASEYGLSAEFFKRQVNAGLSGGEKKQSEAFQLALFEPKFAFLDEIDSGVDRDSLEKIFAVIRALKEKESRTGFLLITHYAKILERISPDKVLVMHGGAIEREGGRELAEEILEKGFEKI